MPQQQRAQDNSGLVTSQYSDVATNVLVPLYINPACLHNIKAALHFPNWLTTEIITIRPLFTRTMPSIPPLLNLSSLTTFPSLNLSITCASPIGHHSPEQPSDISDISSSFSWLSTSTSSIQVLLGSVWDAPVIQPNLSPRKDLKRYYVITVRKCTGVSGMLAHAHKV